jgi:P4 family phage/plasmid primase-like protien
VPKEAVLTHAVEVLRDYYMECVRTSHSPAEAGKWAKRLADLYGTKHVSDALDLLRGKTDFLTRAEQFDADPYVLNTPAGIVDLRSVEVRAHDPDALCTRITNGSPEPQARAERWEQFLREIFAEDNDLIAYLQRVCATAMLGHNREQVLYIMHGTGANGKSVFLNTLLWVLGDYAGSIPRDALLVHAQAQDARRTAYVSLVGVRFAVLDELEDRSRLSSTALKDLTSNNPQSARALYENYRQIQLGCTPFLGTNVRPEVIEHSLGTWRRLRLIPFPVTIPPERRDPELESKLRAEADGIIQWLLEGLRAYWREGLAEPPAVAQATEEYRAEEDVLLDWLSERTERCPGAVTPSAELYADYTEWATANGIDERLGEQAFARQLTAHGFSTTNKRRLDGKQVKARRGIRLLPKSGDRDAVPHGTKVREFQKLPYAKSESAEVFQKPENLVPLGTSSKWYTSVHVECTHRDGKLER